MSETMNPRPGSVAAFKQRHEAYQLVHGMPEFLSDAAWTSAHQPKAALADLEWFQRAVERNPVARQMIEHRYPDALVAVADMRAEAARLAPLEITPIRNGEWLTQDGYTEAKLSIGKSDGGFHYLLEVASPTREADGDWSKPFPTRKAAEGAGHARLHRALDDHPRSSDLAVHPRTPRGEAAMLLTVAARKRETAGELGPGYFGWRGERADMLAEARRTLGEARDVRMSETLDRSRAARSSQDRGR